MLSLHCQLVDKHLYKACTFLYKAFLNTDTGKYIHESDYLIIKTINTDANK